MPYFDARILVFPSNGEIVNHFIWRTRDFRKNSISALADAYFSPKQLHGKKSQLLEVHAVDWHHQAPWSRTGTFVKRTSRDRQGVATREVDVVPTFAANEAWMLAAHWPTD